MKLPTRFGPWTLLGILGWLSGMALAFYVIWHLWTDWYPR
jgi:hypothetical protein